MKAEEIKLGQFYWVVADGPAIRVQVRELHSAAFQFWLCVDQDDDPIACSLRDFIGPAQPL